MKVLLIMMFNLVTIYSWCQIEIDKPIEFNNNNDSLKNIFNIGYPNDTLDGVSFNHAYENPINYTPSIEVNNNINLLTKVSDFELKPGTSFIFKSTFVNNDSLTISINGQGNYNLYKYSSVKLDSADIVINQVNEIVYDGTNFQLLNYKDKECPFGYESVDDNYCIEVNFHPLNSFFYAITYCMDRGGRLCSWSEFGKACEKLNASYGNFTGGWQWVSASSDHNYGAKVVGSGSCDANGFRSSSVHTALFRCCYSK